MCLIYVFKCIQYNFKNIKLSEICIATLHTLVNSVYIFGTFYISHNYILSRLFRGISCAKYIAEF